MRKLCSPRAKVPLNNAAARTREALAQTKPSTIPTGFAAIDEEIGALPVGLLTLLGARTGVGKTTFLAGLARNQVFPRAALPFETAADRLETATGGPFVLFVSCENPVAMIAERMACDMMNIDSSELRASTATAVENSTIDPDAGSESEYIAALERHARLSVIDVDDLGTDNLTRVCNAIEAWADEADAADPDAPRLVLLDYLQRIEPTADQAKEARHRQIELAGKALADLAKTRRLAIVASLQLNDCPDNDEPIRGDSRESKGANNEAGLILLLHTWSDEQRANLRASEADEVLRCVSVRCCKARTARSGWRALLSFDGAHYRVTSAPAGPTDYLRDSDTIKSAKGVRRRHDKTSPLDLLSKGERVGLRDDDHVDHFDSQLWRCGDNLLIERSFTLGGRSVSRLRRLLRRTQAFVSAPAQARSRGRQTETTAGEGREPSSAGSRASDRATKTKRESGTRASARCARLRPSVKLVGACGGPMCNPLFPSCWMVLAISRPTRRLWDARFRLSRARN